MYLQNTSGEERYDDDSQIIVIFISNYRSTFTPWSLQIFSSDCLRAVQQKNSKVYVRSKNLPTVQKLATQLEIKSM